MLYSAVLLALSAPFAYPAEVAPATALHYTPNGNFGKQGTYLPREVGFNLADVSNTAQLASLPAGVRGLVWVGRCNGVDAAFQDLVQPFIGKPKLFGFYLMDDPDPRQGIVAGKMSHQCSPDNLKAESDWIHAKAPGAITFIALMNMSSSREPSFENSYNPTNSHVDLFGVGPYPCRTELQGCDYNMIDRYVNAALASGIPRHSIVPIYQAFGGGDWHDDGGGRYALPTASQARQIMNRWRTLIQTSAFDYAYSWGSQKNDIGLQTAAALRSVFTAHNKTVVTPRNEPALPKVVRHHEAGLSRSGALPEGAPLRPDSRASEARQQ